MKTICILAAVLLLLAVLSRRGLLPLQAKASVFYKGTRRGRSARFISCSGFTRRRLRFRASGAYRFVFRAAISSGRVSAQILDRNRNVLLTLSPAAPKGTLLIDERARYLLAIRFERASGSYDLDWDQVIV